MTESRCGNAPRQHVSEALMWMTIPDRRRSARQPDHKFAASKNGRFAKEGGDQPSWFYPSSLGLQYTSFWTM
eukprot:1926324-Amphidinium_carterae.1